MAFEAVEMFLYSALTKYGVTILKPKNNHTIGLEKARADLNGYLHKNRITSGESLKFNKAEVTMLAKVRDEVVHRGKSVKKKDAVKLSNAAFSFIEHYSMIVFKENILL